MEFMAGNAGSEEDVRLSFIVELWSAEALPAAVVLVELGGAEVVDPEGILNDGGGGGGIALRSTSAFVSSSCLSSSSESTS
jgi:hypothetical protein